VECKRRSRHRSRHVAYQSTHRGLLLDSSTVYEWFTPLDPIIRQNSTLSYPGRHPDPYSISRDDDYTSVQLVLPQLSSHTYLAIQFYSSSLEHSRHANRNELIHPLLHRVREIIPKLCNNVQDSARLRCGARVDLARLAATACNSIPFSHVLELL
jgi:hypothetical protein